MGPSFILFFIRTVIIGTMLNGGYNGHVLKNITCKQTFRFVTLDLFAQVNLRLPVIRR